MGASVGVNMMSVVHEDSSGVSPSFPDVCKTPSPAGPIPLPYPNIAKSSDTADGAATVKCDGNPVCIQSSNFAISTGDEAGTAGGGVVSNKIKGKAEFVNVSFDVKADGKGIARQLDPMLHNDKNTPPFPVLQGPVIAIPKTEKPVCLLCGKSF